MPSVYIKLSRGRMLGLHYRGLWKHLFLKHSKRSDTFYSRRDLIELVLSHVLWNMVLYQTEGSMQGLGSQWWLAAFKINTLLQWDWESLYHQYKAFRKVSLTRLFPTWYEWQIILLYTYFVFQTVSSSLYYISWSYFPYYL